MNNRSPLKKKIPNSALWGFTVVIRIVFVDTFSSNLFPVQALYKILSPIHTPFIPGGGDYLRVPLDHQDRQPFTGIHAVSQFRVE